MVRRAGALAVGASTALMADPLVGLADAAATGRMGVTAQAALAVGTGAVTLAAWLLNPLLFAQTSDVATAWGRGNRVAASRAVAAGAGAAVLAGVVVAVLLVAVAGPLLTAAADDPVARQATLYLRVRALGLPVLALALAGHGALRGRGDTRGSAVIAVSAAALHIAGAALAVRLDRGVGALAAVGVVAQLVAVVAVGLRLKAVGLVEPGVGFGRVRKLTAEAVSALRATGPLALRGLGLGLTTAVLSAAAASLGPTQAAAHLVTYQVWILVALATEGWKAAAQVIVAQGSAGPDEVRWSEARALGRGSAVLGVLAGLALVATMPVLPELLAADPAVAAAAGTLWPVAALALAFGSVAFTRDGIEFGLRRYRAATVRTLRGCGVWLVAAAAGAVTGSLLVLWAVFALGLLARIPGRPRGLPTPPTSLSPVQTMGSVPPGSPGSTVS